ncbi:hypothetical protein Adt_39437 [Abeliophyllum distichum]|uniref:Uncharacterized protein n=1 Tax=Abeliophyllum distichum TaxID=126358 RepID=A0ABD1Q567_9LAMI
MAVDENPFLQPIDINMVTPNLDKLGLPRFKLVIDNREDETRPNAFERLKGKAMTHEGVKLYDRCHKEIGDVTGRSYEQPIRPINATSFHPLGEHVRPFYEKQYGSFQNVRTFRPQPQRPNDWHSYNSKMRKVISFIEMTRTQQRRFQRN